MNAAEELILKKINKMPQISNITITLLNKLTREDFSVSEIVNLIEPDVSLTARCLQLVNSPYFGLTNKVNSIRLAVNFFGRLNLLSMVLVESFKNLLTVSMNFYEEDNSSYWDHALRTAIASKMFAEKAFTGINSDLVYTTGLLHDVGKVVLAESLDAISDAKASLKSQKKPLKFLAVEYEYLGIDHVQAGQQLAEQWKMPDSFIEVIRYHHEPQEASLEYRRLCLAVYYGNLLAKYSPNEDLDLPLVSELLPEIQFKLKDFKINYETFYQTLDTEFIKTKMRLSPGTN